MYTYTTEEKISRLIGKHSISISAQTARDGRWVDLYAINPCPHLLSLKFKTWGYGVYHMTLMPNSNVTILWVGCIGPFMGEDKIWLYNVFDTENQESNYIKHTQPKDSPDVLELIDEKQLNEIKNDPRFQLV